MRPRLPSWKCAVCRCLTTYVAPWLCVWNAITVIEDLEYVIQAEVILDRAEELSLCLAYIDHKYLVRDADRGHD